jgi:RNA polymerase sigma-70 factor (ECF subfamily)
MLMQTTKCAEPCELDPALVTPEAREGIERSDAGDDADAALLRRWGDGDPTAGDELIRRHFAALHRFLRTKVASDAELEDLVQHTLLGCVEARHQYRAEASFRTFLLAIARHKLFAHYRRVRCAPRPILSTLRASATSPTQRFVRGEDIERLVRAMRVLPASMRSVLELSYWSDLGVPAIANRLGIPLNTAYSRLHRAKLALRAAMTDTADGVEVLTKHEPV